MIDVSNLSVEVTEVASIFPTHVWLTQLKREDYTKINNAISQKLTELMANKPALKAGEKWQTEQELHTLDAFQGLNMFIYAAARGTLDYLKVIYEDLLITGCWANISAPGAGHEAHIHPNNYLSGVYYVQTQEGADTITFQDPRPTAHIIAPRVSEDTPDTSARVTVRVKNGTLVIFPAWLVHAVEPNMSDRERISVAFNVMFTSFGEKMARPVWDGNLTIEKER
jgi:uncharacterized protein (TIGR02466 family)